MTSEFFVSSFDKTELYAKKDIPSDPKAIVVIVHGLCEHQGRYDYLMKKLNDSGYGVYRFDHRGHGRSGGKKIFFSDFNEMLDDVNEIVELAHKENPQLPLFVLGHSMGGFAVANYGIKYPGKVKGFITSGALTRNNGGIASGLPKDLPADTYFPNELGAGVCSDPAVVEAYGADPYVEKQISAGLFYEILKGVEWYKENCSRFVDPVLMLHGANDGIVSEKDSRDFFGDISSTDKGLRIYPHLFHEILNEPVKDEVIADIVGWLDKRI
ncbi:MAG TPA: lysophospholipase [Negativicutes bacterium]|nr:lysophospholipase [Negativicutes bacterium]